MMKLQKNYHNKKIRTIGYHTTILQQIIDVFPRHKFDSLAKDYHRGQKFCSFKRWTRLMVMFIGHLSGRKSLHDLSINVTAKTNKLYHLRLKQCSRTTLASVNEKQPTSLYETFFHKLLKRNKLFTPKQRFKFTGKLYLLDATVMDLSLSVFHRGRYRRGITE